MNDNQNNSNDTPLVSVIIPVFNGSKYVGQAIESVLGQTYPRTEIIVVNDGSNDNGRTKAAASRYKDRLKYYEKENGGVASALNFGIHKMSGAYFSWLSHDDLLLPIKIERQINFLRDNRLSNVVLFSDYSIINEKSRVTSSVRIDHAMLENKPEYALLRGLVNGITLLVPRAAFEQFGEFDEALRCTQDYDLWRRLQKKYAFIHVPQILAKTRIHSHQDTVRNPRVVSEGNALWIDMIESVSGERKKAIEGNEYLYYLKMAQFLSYTPYDKAELHCNERNTYIEKAIKNEIERLLVSVIIPFFNRIPLVIRAVNSVMRQTHSNIEILLVDDGSTEDRRGLEQLIREDSRVRIIQMTKNRGPAAARNAGIQQSKGDFIAFLDSDDYFLPEKLAEQLISMKLNRARISHTSYIRHNRGNTQFVDTSSVDGSVVPAILRDCPIATPTVMIDRKLIVERPSFFPEMFRVGEDVCIWLDILRKERILGLQKAYTVVDVTEESSSRNTAKQLEGIANILGYVLSNQEYSGHHDEIASLCSRYIEMSGKLLQKKSELELHQMTRPGLEEHRSRVIRFIKSIKESGLQKTIYVTLARRLLRALKKLEEVT